MKLAMLSKICSAGLPSGTGMQLWSGCLLWAFWGLGISFPPPHPIPGPVGHVWGSVWRQIEKSLFWLPFLPPKRKPLLLDGHVSGHVLTLFPFRHDGICSVFISKCHGQLGLGLVRFGMDD